jgi:Holliday junction resolvase RusA-like endonuclease
MTVEHDGEGRITLVEFVVPGKPLTWQRARRGRHGPSFIPADRESKMSEVRDAWTAMGVPPFDREAYLAIGVAVHCVRPATHYRANGELKDWAWSKRPMGGTNGGDVDNFVKLVKDALNLHAYHDDTQIVEFLPGTGKWYEVPGEMPRTVVRLAPIGSVDVAELAGQEALIPAR